MESAPSLERAAGPPQRRVKDFRLRGDKAATMSQSTSHPIATGPATPPAARAPRADTDERPLDESEQRFRNLMEQAPFSVQVLAPDGTTLRVNRAWEELWGITLERLGGYSVLADPQLEAKGIAHLLRRAFAGEPVEIPAILYDPNETIPGRSIHADPRRWVSAVAYPLKDTDGQVREVVLVHADITDRVRAEEALRASEERYRSLVTATAAIVWSTPASGKFENEQPGWSAFTGQTFEELEGWGWLDAVHPDDRAETTAAWSGALAAGGIYQVEHRLRRADGAYRHMSVRAVPILNERGAVREWVGVHTDVSEQHAADDALRAGEARFRHLADAMPQIVWVTRPNHTLEYINRRWLDYTGQTAEQALGSDGWQAAIHADDVGRLLDASARSEAAGEAFEAEFRVRDRLGAYRWFLGRAVPVHDGAGRVVCWFGTSTDIDDRRRAENDARFLAEASAALAEAADEAVTLRRVAQLAVPSFADWCTVDLANDSGAPRRLAVAHVDPAKVEYAHELRRRYPPDPDSPHGVFQVFRSGQPELVQDVTDAMLEAAAHDPEHLRIAKALGLRSYMCVPLRGRGGVLGAISFVSAESGRRYGPNDLRLAEDLARRAAIAIENARLYDALRRADRRKDEFLATLAHELRNPLAAIRNALHLMAEPGTDARDHEPERAMAERQAIHLGRLVDDLLDVARISRGKIALRRQVVELGVVVRNAAGVVRPAAAERGCALSVEAPAEPVLLEADPTRLEQIIDNLLTNAVKYTPPGGRVVVQGTRQGSEAVIRVRDNGAGIAPEMLSRLFEMFVQGQAGSGQGPGGLGIGLGLVKGLVELHGGTVEAHSAGVGTGSEFVVRLPAVVGPATQHAAPPRARPEPAGDTPAQRRVLVVDDNQDAANSLGKLLSRLYGQNVRVAHGGPEALAVAGEFEPEVVLLDLGMPGMDGYEVARRLRERPDANGALLVALTGWGQDSDRRKSREAGFDRHLVKPVDLEVLRDLLASID